MIFMQILLFILFDKYQIHSRKTLFAQTKHCKKRTDGYTDVYIRLLRSMSFES